MRIAIGGDHNGFQMKNEVAHWLRGLGHDVEDVGPHTFRAEDDYPDFVFPVADRVVSRQAERGVLICGSGVGASVAANKVPGVRAGLCHDIYSAHQGVEHDDMNILCLGARVIGLDLARELVQAFLAARFTREERHLRRLSKVQAAEDKLLGSRVQEGQGA